MKICSNCGSEIKEDAKFCTECGSLAEKQEKKDVHTQQQQAPQQASQHYTAQGQNEAPEPQAVQMNINQEKVNKLTQNYFSYFKRTVKNPSLSFTEVNPVNGYIQFGLLSLLFSIMMIFLANWYSYSSVGFIDFIRSFAIQCAVYLIMVGVTYFLKKVVYKTNESFGVVTTQLGGLFSAAVLLQLIMLIFSVLSPGGSVTLIATLSLLTLLISFIAFNIYLFQSTSNSKLDKFYIALIGNLLIVFIYIAIIRFGVTTFMENYEYIFNSVL
ncbi:MAG: zinc ribbon domain-containing protein [Carnobacterium sp.]|uniref:Zinc-ribbon domain-containing protein n=1 Tax=Carnobacterium antarcticum TaxID=2126436 RepID=A0ABW4NLE6_9LACT|nr:zinc ribbon domain-containing protein [Carnobacterium sp. CP1]ALV21634.1 hypothetical protein NY10_1023 [Carnobacterium sp. CP1]